MDEPQSAETGESLPQFRGALRARLIAAREGLPPQVRSRSEEAISRGIERLLARLAPRVTGFCWPIRGEFDARALMARRIAAGMRGALPVLVAADAPLEFRAWTPDTPLHTDRHGIRYPAQGAPVHPEVILLPLVGFDAAGFRLGYGGGYFDRTLAALDPRPIAVGAGFELARVASIRPQPHDLPMDWVVTETGLFRRGARGLSAEE
ncbi:MAG: 5-formyltetrahydrofolate cyclo-ligase [Betaproteobacteria bacterium CG2_30_68_42]|nr:MAG: 5-formyltetrahydrofolate cyclo-ligase [Betaproteobacteria bacterium CG2_30_68_42]